MKPTKKIRSTRGTTLAEVLLVVALIVILLGVAVPDIIGYSRMIKLTAMNDNARAVAVAVQSKLYSMQNSGTSDGSEYAMLKDCSIEQAITVKDGEATKSVTGRYVCNWDVFNEDTDNEDTNKESAEKNNKMLLAKQMLLSGAITDVKLLNSGYIVAVYDPSTADLLYVYYSDKPFDVAQLFPTENESFLQDNFIGKYIGEPSPVPSYKATLPRFSCEWVFDDEMYLQLTMIDNPADSLLNMPLGLEVFANLPDGGKLMIYAEGFFASDYVTTWAGTIVKDDGNPLTLQKIKDNNRHLRFALDSLVMKKANYGNQTTQGYLRHQNHPEITTMAENLLYPREAISDWFNGQKNPYLTVFARDYSDMLTEDLETKLKSESTLVTDYVPVDASMSLTVKLHVLSEKEKDANYNDNQYNSKFFKFDDEAYTPIEIVSENMSPYFYALSGTDHSVTISSMRDFGNLSYVFNDPVKSKSITSANLAHDISGQQFYDKLSATRYALIQKAKNVDLWEFFANNDTIGTDPLVIQGRDSTFTIDGQKPNGGNYSISNVEGGSRYTSPGGFFTFAENVEFKNIDVVNPRSWRNNYTKAFLSDLNNIDLDWQSVASGSFVGIAVNCRFDNVHAYIDSSQSLMVEVEDGGLQGDRETRGSQPITQRRIAGTVVGGLVGLAIGDSKKASVENKGETSFNNCAASALLATEYYFASSQCVYAGGLVGIAFGNVYIGNSYAASSLSGYYSGGLVGATSNGTWKYTNNTSTIIREGHTDGTLTVDNSFAAGHISRVTHVGAGLIACYDYESGTKPKVNGCYSAVQWDILTPVAYGTFNGDADNYYVSQIDLSLPITANLEAHFKVISNSGKGSIGDVIAQNGKNQSGIPCTAEELNNNFTKEKGWDTVSNTSRWRYSEGGTDVEQGNYPFPMPESNDKFWGDWINAGYYKEEGKINANEKLKIAFDCYICPYYSYPLDWGKFPIHVDTGNIVSKTQDNRLWIRYEGSNPIEPMVGGYLTEGAKIQAAVQKNIDDAEEYFKSTTQFNDPDYMNPKNYSYWARGAVWTESKLISTDPKMYARQLTTYGQGIDGATKITLDPTGENYVIEGAPFYDPAYNPITGYDFKPEGIQSKVSQLNWDYYGFYFTAIDNDDPYVATIKYYIQFDEGVQGTNFRAVKDGDDASFLYVNEQEFKKALNYYNPLTLPTDINQLNLVWESGYFQIKEA